MVSLKWGYARRTTPPAGEVTSTYAVRLRAGRACVLAGLAMGHGFLPLGASADAIDFARDIQPIFSRNCYECHGPDAHARQAELRLDIKGDGVAGIIAGGESGESELIRRIVSTDPEVQMPPPGPNRSPLPAEAVDKLRAWVAAGAPWATPCDPGLSVGPWRGAATGAVLC